MKGRKGLRGKGVEGHCMGIKKEPICNPDKAPLLKHDQHTKRYSKGVGVGRGGLGGWRDKGGMKREEGGQLVYIRGPAQK